jgi:hypothetical protein
MQRSAPEINKAIQSLGSRIAEHQQKIVNPRSLDYFERLTPTQLKNLVQQHWPQEIQNFREQIKILQEILKSKQ